MDSRWLKIVLSILTVMSVFSMDAGAAAGPQSSQPRQESCEPSRNGLAMDQRDEARLQCLKKKKVNLSVSQCLTIAKSMEYSNNAEEARMVCLYDLKSISLKECAIIAKNMEYADTGDETKWHCIRQFNKSISKKQCQKLAKSMSYPANTDRAEMYCENELH